MDLDNRGIMVAVLIFTIAYMQIQNTIKASIEKKGVESFNQVVSIINNLCWSFAGNTRQYDLDLGETIEGIYATSNTSDIYSRENLINSTLSERRAFGDSLCLKIKGKRVDCQKLDCSTIFPFIGYVPEKYSLSSEIGKILGKGNIFSYHLEFLRTNKEAGVEVFSGLALTTTTIFTTTTLSVT